MAESNTTKRALSNALKSLLEEQPLEKISISDICDRCHMNRKSFYYHFRDKYDLVNWIFDTEFVALHCDDVMSTVESSYGFDDRWKNVEEICGYFDDHRSFYRRIFKVEGQNSFEAHFRELIEPLFRLRVEDLMGMEDVPELVYDFAVDGVISFVRRWLTDKNYVSKEEFLFSLKKLIQVLYVDLDRQFSADPRWLDA